MVRIEAGMWSYYLLLCCAISINFVSGYEFGECSKGRPDFLPQIIQGFYSLLNTSECELAQNTQFRQCDPVNEEPFDFIIVGAGPAGSILANKLSANPNWRVLLLEAGGDPTMTSEIPGLTFFSQGTDIDWKYFTEHEDGIYWGTGVNGSTYWPRGKGLGGSTLLNAMVYTRGFSDNFNGWAKEGNTNWSYDDLLPYFIKLENMKAEEVLKCESCMKYHSTEGDLQVESYTRQALDEYSQILVDGLKTLGYGLYPDINNPEMAIKGGFYFLQATMKNGRRNNAAKAFLSGIQDRPNLCISKNSYATQILINENKEAYGVKFTNRFGNSIDVKATKQVISSGGAVNTPQLMMLSGIGPQKLLQDQGVQNIIHSPFVGENLQDHAGFNGIVISITKQFPKSDKILLDQLFEYLSRSSGVMLNLGTIGSNAIFINSGATEDTKYPDVELLLGQYDRESPSIPQVFGSFTPDVLQLFTDLNKEKALIILRAIVLKPKSRGRIVLRSSNPEDPPKIYSGYYSDPSDFKPVVATIRIIEKLVQSKPMQDIGAKLEFLQYPRCKDFFPGSDEYWACAVKYLVVTSFHPCCTMKMGPDTDETAVLDNKLKVRGVKGLTVADFSAAPSLVSGHSQTISYVIGMKAADFLIDEFSSQQNSTSYDEGVC